MIPRLETERLFMREWRQDDLDAFASFLADPEVMRYLGGSTVTRGGCSPSTGVPGKAACTAKCRSDGNSAVSSRCVVPCSIERWRLKARLAGVKCTRPSAVSADGLTVAAFAAHIAEAELAAASSSGASAAARRISEF